MAGVAAAGTAALLAGAARGIGGVPLPGPWRRHVPLPWALLRAREHASDAPKGYKETLNLPTTDFPMRADAAVRELSLQEHSIESLYRWQAAHNPGPPFVLHDGPPYANGPLHMGHLLNKVLKDFINRHQVLRGRRVHYVPGWDCHGLPIELKALEGVDREKRAQLQPLELRQIARKLAEGAVASQMAGFRRWGVMADWGDHYTTMQPQYEAAQLRVFQRMVESGRIFRGMRPVYWSPSSRTALAESELEYPEGGHTSRACYATFPLAGPPPAGLAGALGGGALSAVVWTTTPWTLPANVALCVGPGLQYVAARAPGTAGPAYLVAEERLGALAHALSVHPEGLQVLGAVAGAELAGAAFHRPLAGPGAAPVPVLLGAHVTDDSGTGIVHTAPGHGQDDFVTCRAAGILDLPVPVDDAGRFTAEADSRAPLAGAGGAPLAGLPVLGAGTEAVLAAMRAGGSLLLEEPHNHRYPYDWRTKKPVITRATTQWFARLGHAEQEAARAAVEGVDFVPAIGRARLGAMLGRREWCISRQRAWGVPIPVLYDKETGEELLTAETVEHVAALVEDHGTDCWWSLPVEELLPPRLRGSGREYVRGPATDTMDVWFDSGSSWAAVLGARGGAGCAEGGEGRSPLTSALNPADVYLEGSDQHRGWFNSSLQTSIATGGGAPYRTVITHGFVLDEKRAKMSKSLGNVVDPMQLIAGGGGGGGAAPAASEKPGDQEDKKKKGKKKNGKGGGGGGGGAAPAYGADVLRLWVAGSDFTRDVLVGGTVLSKTSDAMRKLRNTCRYLLGNLGDFDPARHAVAPRDLPPLERYMLHKLAGFSGGVQESYDQFRYSLVVADTMALTANEISAFYAESAKDILYCDPVASPRRRAAQTALWHSLQALLYAVAPVAPHTAEDVYRHLPPPCRAALAPPGGGDAPPSVFQTGWLQRSRPGEGGGGGWAEWWDGEHAEDWEGRLRPLRGEVNKVLEGARVGGRLSRFLEARVVLTVEEDQPGGQEGRALLELLRAAMPPPPGGATPGPRGHVPGLEDLFVVSEVAVRCGGEGSPPPRPEGAHFADVTLGGEGGGGGGEVRVSIDMEASGGDRCGRCWKHTAPHGAELCPRCHSACASRA